MKIIVLLLSLLYSVNVFALDLTVSWDSNQAGALPESYECLYRVDAAPTISCGVVQTQAPQPAQYQSVITVTDPVVTTTYNVQVRACHAVEGCSAYSNVVSESFTVGPPDVPGGVQLVVGAAPTLIIDNSDDEAIGVGSWQTSTTVGWYGPDSVYSDQPGDSYTYTSTLTGSRIVSLWWTAHVNRSTLVQVQIYDGPTLLDTLTVNQQVNGGQWNSLPQYNFTVAAIVVITVPASGGQANADAVRIQ